MAPCGFLKRGGVALVGLIGVWSGGEHDGKMNWRMMERGG
jgi:hypothetical protein